MQLELPLLSAIGITGLKFAIHSGMAGWLWALPARCLRGSKHHQQKREPAERARRKVPVGLLVCIRAETLVSTALPTSLCCLRFKWDAISPLCNVLYICLVILLCVLVFLQIHQLMEALWRVLPASPRGHSLCMTHAKAL